MDGVDFKSFRFKVPRYEITKADIVSHHEKTGGASCMTVRVRRHLALCYLVHHYLA
jgi:hypothetical protein